MKRISIRLLNYLFPNSNWGEKTEWKSYLDRVHHAVRNRQFDRIEGLLDEALAWVESEKVSPSSRPGKLNELATLYQSLVGDNSQAEKLFRQAAHLTEKLRGPESIAIAEPLNNLSLLLIDQRRASEAKEILERLLPIVKREFGNEHLEVASCLENLAAALRQMGATEEAATFRAEALGIRRKAPPG